MHLWIVEGTEVNWLNKHLTCSSQAKHCGRAKWCNCEQVGSPRSKTCFKGMPSQSF